MPRANIIDRAPLKTRETTTEGYLRAEAAVTRAGIFEYTGRELGLGDDDAVYKVMRTRESTFNDTTISSLRGSPVTLLHPKKGVSPSNYQRVVMGNLVGEPKEISDDRLGADILIGAQKGITAVKDGGIEELSVGYGFDFIEAGDTEEYDFISDGPIHINHVALVERGRAGKNVRIFDSEDETEDAAGGPEMDMKELAATIAAALKDSQPESRLDTGKVVEAVTGALTPAIDEVRKTAEATAKAQAEDKAQRDAADAKAQAEKAAQDFEAAVIAKRDAYWSSVSDAMHFIPADKQAEARTKPLREVLLMAIGDKLPGAENMSDEALQGALAAMRQAQDAGPPQPGQGTPQTSMPPATRKVAADANAGARDAAYKTFVDSYKLHPNAKPTLAVDNTDKATA